MRSQFRRSPALLFFLLAACGSDVADDGAASEAADAAADATGPGVPQPATGDAGSTVTQPTNDAGARDAQTDAAPATLYTGEATYYDADGTGACGFAASPNDLLVAAMNKAQYSKSLCGKCVHAKGPKGEVTVRIVDLCPGCKSGDLDLSVSAFQAISPLSAGRVKITWSFVPCP